MPTTKNKPRTMVVQIRLKPDEVSVIDGVAEDNLTTRSAVIRDWLKGAIEKARPVVIRPMKHRR